MMYVSGLFLVLGFSFSLFADNSCECPKLGCDPCSVERGVKFFTEKCGPSNGKVKSCARPTCVPIDVATRECPVLPKADAGPRAPVVVTGNIASAAPAADASQVASAGKVKVLQGSVSITHADGQKTVVVKEADVAEGDRIESAKDGGAVVHFNGGNKLHVQPDTAVEIKEFRDQQAEGTRKAMLNLIRGKIRNQVTQKYNGKTSYYRVSTKGAVAGVRGTDFVVEHRETGKLETRIETLEGRVTFMNLDETDSREVAQGEGASYVAPLPTSSDFIVKGKLSDVYKMNPEYIAVLDTDTRMDVIRVAKRDTATESLICDKPKAALNKCSWRCENNPKGEKICRTDLDNVRCVRQRCNANGVWADEARMPAAIAPNICPPSGFDVKDCDY